MIGILGVEQMELQTGVNLHLQALKKFKTITLSFYFRSPLSISNITKRTLLAQLIETNAKDYPTQTAMNQATSDLYGLSFSTQTAVYGQEHAVILDFTFVDPRYLNLGQNYLEEVFAFIENVIFAPNIEAGAFDQSTFATEKVNLREYVLAKRDDKTFETIENLLALTYTNPAKQNLMGVDLDRLAQLTARDLANSYQSLIEKDAIDIIISGNIAAEAYVKHIQSFPFAARDVKPACYYTPIAANTKPIIKTKESHNRQTKIAQAYKTTIRQTGRSYYAGLAFNSLFGGDLHSKLFQSIREKENLAYSISSSLMVDDSLLLVYAGIDQSANQKVQDIIAEQLQIIVEGKISAGEWQATKRAMINRQKSSEDSSHWQVRYLYEQILMQETPLTLAERITAIEQLTLADVVAVAQNVMLQTTFILKGQ